MELFDRPSLERLSGLAFFSPADGSGAIPLGNIELLKLDFGLKTKDYPISIRGDLRLRKRRVISRAPVYSIQGNQFASETIPLLILGEREDDYAQTAGAHTFAFTAQPGRAVQLPHLAATIATVSVDGEEKTLGYDFYVDHPALDPQGLLCHTGWIVLPQKSGTIVANDIVSVDYSAPALSLEEYTAFATPSRDGTLVVHAEDEHGPPPRETWIMDVTLYCKAAPETKVEKFRSWSLEAAIYGQPIVRKRPNAYPYLELITGTGDILDLSP